MRKFIVSITVIVLAALITGGVVIADSGMTVYTRGTEELVPNTYVRADLRFSPGPTTIKSGETVTWVHADQTDAPHTVTLATPDALVQEFIDLFAGTCPACDAAIGAALAGHFPGGPPVRELDDGDGQFDDPGDSLLFFHGESVSAEINAPPGTTLYYFCAIHPWMQGTIEVK